MYLEIRCPKCFELAKQAQVDMNALNATCKKCGNSYDFSFDINQRLRKKGEIFQPEGFYTMKSMSELEIKIPFETNEPSTGMVPVKLIMRFQQVQSGCMIVFLSIFAVFFAKGVWDQFQYDKSWGAYWNLLGALILPTIIFFIGKKFWATPSSIIHLDKNLLKIKLPRLNNGDNENRSSKPKKPLKFEMKAGDIKQVFVVEINMAITAYQVVLLDSFNQQHFLFMPFFNLDHALYIEQEIETFLNITDEMQPTEIQL